MEKKQRGLLLDVSGIMSVGMLIYFIHMTTAVLPYLAEEFPQYSLTTVKLFATIPSLALIFCSPILSRLFQKFPIKRIALVCGAGLLLSGLGCYVTHNLIGILALRCVYGVCYGMIFPLANTLIQQLYTGERRANLMGLRAGVSSLFGAALVALGGVLLESHWRYIFLGYLIIIPLLIWIALFCPTNEPYAPKKEEKIAGEKWYTGSTWVMLVLMTLLNIFMMAFAVEVSLVVVNGGLGNANDASRVIMANTIFSFLVGLVFGKVNKKMKMYTLSLASLLAGIAYLMGAFAGNMWILLAVGAIYGLSFGMFHPVCNLMIASTASSPRRAPTAIAAYTCGMGIGQMLYPYIIEGLRNLFGLPSGTSEWLISGVIMIVLSVITAAYFLLSGRRQPEKAA